MRARIRRQGRMLRMPPDQLLDSKHTLREWTLWSCSGWLWLKREGFFIFGIDSTVYNQEELPLRFRSVEGFTDTEHMRHQFMTFFGSEIAALFVRFLDSCLQITIIRGHIFIT